MISFYRELMDLGEGTHSPLENFSSYRGDDWSPERLAFHQNSNSSLIVLA